MSVQIHPEQQIQRINALLTKLEEVRRLSTEELTKRPNEKAWSVIEVVKHMSIAHIAYRKKVKKALASPASTKEGIDGIRSRAIPGFLIKRFPPKDGKIRFKMKTMRAFQPLLNLQNVDTESEFIELKQCLEELKKWVNTYRTQPVSLRKFNSAIGAMVRFNIPEACEFILCHNERHFHQVSRILQPS